VPQSARRPTARLGRTRSVEGTVCAQPVSRFARAGIVRVGDREHKGTGIEDRLPSLVQALADWNHAEIDQGGVAAADRNLVNRVRGKLQPLDATGWSADLTARDDDAAQRAVTWIVVVGGRRPSPSSPHSNRPAG